MTDDWAPVERDALPGGPDATVERLETLLARLAALPAVEARVVAEEVVSTLLELYGEALARIVALIERRAGGDVVHDLAADGVVASVLLVHGLHPVDLRTRVEEALDEVRPYMASHGGAVELVSLEGDVARLRLLGACHGCPASRQTLEQAVHDALDAAAPDLLGIEVEGLAGAAPTSGPVPVTLTTSGEAGPARTGGAT